VIPEGRRPPPPGDLSVTGNGDLPLATQRRVESIASDRLPLRRRLDRIYQLGLWLAIFFARRDELGAIISRPQHPDQQRLAEVGIIPEMPVEEARDFLECLPGFRRVHITLILHV
jgi:hypothetical protein